MRNYELLLILKPTLTEEELQNKIVSTKELIEKNGGDIAAFVDMGTRKLAYEIEKFERGVYVIFYFSAPTESIQEIERIVRINEEIIKFMTIRYEGKKEIAHWETLVKNSNKSNEKKEEPKQESTKENAPESSKETTKEDISESTQDSKPKPTEESN